MAERHPTWAPAPGALVARVEGPLFYANATTVKERLLEQARQAEPRPACVVLELAESPELDVATLDILGELADSLERQRIELRLASVRAPALGARTCRARRLAADRADDRRGGSSRT